MKNLLLLLVVVAFFTNLELLGAAISCIKNNNLEWLLAAKNGDILTIKQLISEVNSSVADTIGKTALIRACQYGHLELVHYLLATKNIDINIQDKSGKTALMHAIIKDHLNIVGLLLSKDFIDINIQDEEGKTALMWAVQKGNVEIVQLILKYIDIDLYLKNRKALTAFKLAERKGEAKIASLIRNKTKSVELSIESLFNSIAAGDITKLKLNLIRTGTKVKNPNDLSPLISALISQNMNIEIIKLILYVDSDPRSTIGIPNNFKNKKVIDLDSDTDLDQILTDNVPDTFSDKNAIDLAIERLGQGKPEVLKLLFDLAYA